MRPLRPVRTPTSERLDQLEVKTAKGKIVTIPNSKPWPEIYDYLAETWRIGEHFSMVGTTGSGKTTFAREVLDLRDWVVVLATKAQDKDLFAEFMAKGYVLKRDWSPSDTENKRVIFAPSLTGTSPADKKRQGDAFRKVLDELFQLEGGNWTVFADEIRYLTDNLKLATEWETLELQGRSLGLTLVTATQRPRNVPREVFGSATYHAFWRMPNAEDRQAAADLIGGEATMAREAMAVLPSHEFLLVNSVTDKTVRGRVYG